MPEESPERLGEFCDTFSFVQCNVAIIDAHEGWATRICGGCHEMKRMKALNWETTKDHIGEQEFNSNSNAAVDLFFGRVVYLYHFTNSDLVADRTMSPNRRDVFTVAVLLPCFGTAAVAARFYTRYKKRAGLGSDDWTILVCLVLTWLLGAILIVGAAISSLGISTDIDPITGEGIIGMREINQSKIDYAYNIILFLTIGLIKLSVLLLYRRIFVGRVFDWVSLGMCVLIGSWTISFLVAEVFQCRTFPAAAWTSGKAIVANCVEIEKTQLAFAVSDIITDLMILIIPVRLISKLQMSTPNKLAVIGIFLLGLISTASAIVRLTIVLVTFYDTSAGYRDVIGIGTSTFVWSQVEAGVAVVAACLPTLRPLLSAEGPQRFYKGLLSALTMNSAKASKSQETRFEEKLSNESSTRDGLKGTVYGASNPSVNVEVMRGSEKSLDVPDHGILKQNGFSYTESRI